VNRDSVPVAPDDEAGKKGKIRVHVLNILRSFWFNLFAIAVGILIGLLSPETGKSLRLFGQLYLSLLTMTVLPIVFSAITHGVGQLLRSGRFSKSVGYLIMIFVGWVLLGSLLGILAGTVGKAGTTLPASDLHALGSLLIHDPGSAVAAKGPASGLSGFLHQLIPRNVFQAFVGGRSLAVVFISILMGIALGTNLSQASERLLETVRGIYETFFKIMGWVLYGLPFGLCCLTAEQVATVGTSILLVLLKLIVLFYAGCVLLCLIYLVTMGLVTGRPVGKILSSLKDALLLSFVASNSMVAMPIAMQSLEDDMDQPYEVVQLVVPLAVAMNRHAYPLLFALVTVYVSQAYGHPLGIKGLIEVCIASAFVGMAAVGPAASVAPMAAVVIFSVGLPTQLGIVALVETTAVVTPMVAMTHLFGSCATATIISSIQGRKGNR
jgi:Na+/H+-dicarboxylate symporter